MSAPDRSWTITPTLVAFSVVAVVALRIVDGDWSALADRLTHPRDTGGSSGGAGPTFQASVPAQTTDDVAKPPVAAPVAPGSRDVGSLDDVCIDGTDAACKRWAMDGFYAAVKQGRAGTLGRPVRVSWYGDSVVASDALPGNLRSRLQAELGDGGPGFVYAMAPHRFCGHASITRGGGDNWLAYAISTVHTGDGFYGPGGSSAETNSGTVTIKTSTPVTSAELYYLAQPTGGTAVLKGDGTELVRQSTAAKAKTAAWVTGTAPAGARKFELKGQGKTRVFGLALENAKGAVVDNFGIVNVNAKTFSTHNQAAYIAQLQHRNADLLILMIGANEAQWLKVGDKAMKDYQAQYEKVLGPLRQARPDATCLVMSPTDEAEPKGDGKGYQSRPIISAIVAAQRKAAHAQGCAFYSSFDWMGGAGSAQKWFKKRLISSDMIHLTTAGAQKMSGGLFEALLAGSKLYAGN